MTLFSTIQSQLRLVVRVDNERDTSMDIHYVLDKNGNPQGVIVPMRLWREIQSERETAHLLKSHAMKKRLVNSKRRVEGIPFEVVREKLGI
jgi:hypothetical protein